MKITVTKEDQDVLNTEIEYLESAYSTLLHVRTTHYGDYMQSKASVALRNLKRLETTLESIGVREFTRDTAFVIAVRYAKIITEWKCTKVNCQMMDVYLELCENFHIIIHELKYLVKGHDFWVSDYAIGTENQCENPIEVEEQV